MNGARADPPPITMRMPSSSSTMISGANQNFFRAFRNFQRSFKKSIYCELQIEYEYTNAILTNLIFHNPFRVEGSAKAEFLIQLKFLFPFIRCFLPGRLFLFCKHIIIDDEVIHLCPHETTVRIFRTADNRFSTNIETCVNN
jgi:hypothetical protein